LAYRSHFYEFQNLDSNEILPSWRLQEGMHVMPIVTTGSGFSRYLIEDVLEVSGFWHQVPCFRFLGRAQHTDLVGEKIEARAVLEIFQKLAEARPVSLFACPAHDGRKPHYVLLAECGETQMEKHLREHFHYRLARDLEQLEAVRLRRTKDPVETYYQLMENRGLKRGDVKIEPLNVLLRHDELDTF